MYFEWASPHINELQGEIGPLESKVKELQGHNDLLIREDKELVTTNLTLKETKQNLQLDIEKIEAEVNKRKEVLNNLKELADKGVPFELIKRIQELEFNGGEELVSRIKTAEAYNELVEAEKELERTVNNLEGNKAKAEKELNKLKGDIGSQRNELDAEREKTRTYREVIEGTEAFLKDGYSIKDLNSLRNGLKAVAIEGKPLVSLSRLINGLQNAKSLSRLDDMIEERNRTLETLNSKISAAEGTLTVYEQIILKRLDEAASKGLGDLKNFCESTKNSALELNKKAIDQMNSVGSSYIAKLESIDKSYTVRLESINITAVNNLNKIIKTASNTTANLNSETAQTINTLKNSVSTTTQQFIKDMEDYNQLKDKIRDQAILSTYGYYLLGVLKLPEEIKKIPLSIIALLTDRINLYTQLTFPDVMVFPSEKVSSGYTGFSRYTQYQLPSLTLFLKEEFENRNIKAEKQ